MLAELLPSQARRRDRRWTLSARVDFDDLPTDVQRLLATRAAFEQLGFDLERHVFIGPVAPTPGSAAPAPAGLTYLAAIVSLAGDPCRPDFAAIAGMVSATWWNDGGAETARAAWNALPAPRRHAVREAHVDAIELRAIATDMMTRGLIPPALLQRPWKDLTLCTPTDA
jgi:hypothetical protein